MRKLVFAITVGATFLAGTTLCRAEWQPNQVDLQGIANSASGLAESAIRSIVRLGDLSAVDSLKRIASDPKSSLRNIATWALVELMAFDPVKEWVAAKAVEEIGQPAAGFLIGALTHKDRNVRYRAAAILGRMAEDRAVDALRKAVDDTDVLVRRHAIVALGFIGDKVVAPTLIRAMKDSDGVVKENAIWALGMIKSNESIPHLIAALDSENRNIRFRAVNALAQIGGEAAIEAISKKTSDPDPMVSETARNALRRLVQS
ncbi:MAG: HEAT repeat domain-containing protein [Fimbriimonadales bacterium]|nr:HEAT repeat domain-containing protein [Fimbriimonadales bacterium]